MPVPGSTMKVAAVGGIALSTIVVGVAAANAAPTALPGLSLEADATAEAVDSADATGEDGGRGPAGRRHGKMRGESAAALAEKLGVEEGALEDAVAAVRERVRENGRDALAAALAEELGIEESAVTEALDELRTERRDEARTSFAERLDAAVEEGTLTEADKESVLKAFDAGILGRGPGGHR